jgi:hypothetical protein
MKSSCSPRDSHQSFPHIFSQSPVTLHRPVIYCALLAPRERVEGIGVARGREHTRDGSRSPRGRLRLKGASAGSGLPFPC